MHLGWQRHVGLVAYVCVSGEADCSGVFQPNHRVAGEEVCVQVPPADGEWERLCVASELTGVPPGVHCICLSVHGSD